VLRHPHVYPRADFDASALVTADDIAAHWKRIKSAADALLNDADSSIP
jgi:uncharacterized protein YabN with tetrapyrrole methylase and pyrophosphatase domain